MSMYVWSERTGISDSAFRVASLVTNQLLLRELCKHCCSLLLGYGVARKQQGFQKQPTDSVVLATDGSKCLDWAQLSTRTYQHPSKTCHMQVFFEKAKNSLGTCFDPYNWMIRWWDTSHTSHLWVPFRAPMFGHTVCSLLLLTDPGGSHGCWASQNSSDWWRGKRALPPRARLDADIWGESDTMMNHDEPTWDGYSSKPL